LIWNPSQVLIPLDGTHEAEAVLGFCSPLTRAGATTFHLLAVVEALDDEEMRDGELRQAHEQGRTNLEAYVEATAHDLRERLSVEVRSQIRTGVPASEILAAANELAADMIALATHGRTGMDRWRLGSVADRVLGASIRPTFLIGPNARDPGTPAVVTQIAVPLDGSLLAEQAIPPAMALARSLEARLELVTVPSYHVPFGTGPYLSLNFRNVIARLEERARLYLENVRIPDMTHVNRVTLTHTASKDAGRALNRHFAELPGVLVVMTSHGRTGLTRWALGSVAEEVIRGPAPVLIFRVSEAQV
jgi:nucleotide-binding universal stress UspA family protein